MKRIKSIVMSLLIILLVVSGCGNSGAGEKVTVFKSPTCGCCTNYVGDLKGEGYSVEVVQINDVSKVNEEHNIPSAMSSCHVTFIGDYFVAGHVPLEVLTKLITEKPEIDGVSLPNMPMGSPGMPGIKKGDFIIYSVKEGQYEEYMRV